jgi:hypothetical protein
MSFSKNLGAGAPASSPRSQSSRTLAMVTGVLDFFPGVVTRPRAETLRQQPPGDLPILFPLFPGSFSCRIRRSVADLCSLSWQVFWAHLQRQALTAPPPRQYVSLCVSLPRSLAWSHSDAIVDRSICRPQARVVVFTSFPLPIHCTSASMMTTIRTRRSSWISASNHSA